MAEAGSLHVTLGLSQDDFQRGIRQAAQRLDELEGATDKAGRKISDFSGRLQNVGGALSKYVSAPLAAAATAAFAFASNFASAGDEIAKTASKIGISTDALQELRHAAQMSSVSADELDDSLKELALRTGEAAQGSGELMEVLERYGISATDAAGKTKDAETMLADIATAMAGAATQADRLFIANQAFGESGLGMATMLADGAAGLDEMRARAHELGAVLGTDALEASEKFKANMVELQTSMAAAGNSIGVALLPAFSELIPLIVENVVPAIASMAEHVAGAIQWFAGLPEPVQTAAGVIAGAFAVGGPVLLAVGTFAKVLGALVVAAGPIGLFIAAATLAFTAWQLWGDQITELVTSVTGWLGETFTAFSETAVGIWQGMGEMVLAAFSAPFGAIKGISDAVVGGMAQSWEWLQSHLVANSIIPDMLNMMEVEFGRLWGMAAETDRVAGAMASSWEKSAADQEAAIGALTTNSLSLLGRMFEGSKTIAIATALVNTWKGVSETLATYPWPIAGALAATHAAAGLANVASIRSASSSGGGGRRGGGRGGSAAPAAAAAAPPAAQQVTRIEGIRPGDLFTGEQLIELIGDAQRRGSSLALT